jgi:hypothetical protein
VRFTAGEPNGKRLERPLVVKFRDGFAGNHNLFPFMNCLERIDPLH